MISVMVKFDGVEDVLAYPGFHQLFFYGNFRQQLVDFCRLLKLRRSGVSHFSRSFYRTRQDAAAGVILAT